MTGPLVQMLDVRKEFRASGSTPPVRAVDGVSLDVLPGETVGLVGESGSGKTTLARMLVGLVTPSGGCIRVDGVDLATLSSREWRGFRRNVQMVFQDPFTSLNPRMTVEQALARPLRIHGLATARTARDRVVRLLEMVGLRPEHARRYPHELSGGQQQRVGIARALALGPKLTVLDEPTSALDVSVQAQILSLLRRLQRELSLTFLFISHDLSVIQYLSDRIAVLYRGQVMEVGEAVRLVREPRHPYTRLLLGSVPPFYGPTLAVARPVPPAASAPGACPFYARCASRSDLCRARRPELAPVAAGHQVACFHPYQEGVHP